MYFSHDSSLPPRPSHQKSIQVIQTLRVGIALGLILSFPNWGFPHEKSVSENTSPHQTDPNLSHPSTSAPNSNIQEEFIQALKHLVVDRRKLYEQYYDALGAEGILKGIEIISPQCHSEAHDLGKVIFTRKGKIEEALKICDARCHSGCMHGVLMEAFSTLGRQHSDSVDYSALRPMVSKLCHESQAMTTSYSPGDCAHGVGHAFAVVAEHKISEALKGCSLFPEIHGEYYCATGVYMEYVTTFDKVEAKTKSWFYPCDTFKYVAACARYKMVHVVRRHYQERHDNKDKETDLLKQQCQALSQPLQVGCFHGLGNAHSVHIYRGVISLSELCGTLKGDKEFACIDGAIERMAKYDQPRAFEVCQTLAPKQQNICMAGAKRKMYNMTKDLKVYTQQ